MGLRIACSFEKTSISKTTICKRQPSLQKILLIKPNEKEVMEQENPFYFQKLFRFKKILFFCNAIGYDTYWYIFLVLLELLILILKILFKIHLNLFY